MTLPAKITCAAITIGLVMTVSVSQSSNTENTTENIETVVTAEIPDLFELTGFENIQFEKYLPQTGIAFSGDTCQKLTDNFSASLITALSSAVTEDANRTMDMFLEHANHMSLNIVENSLRCSEERVVQGIYESTIEHFNDVLSESQAFRSFGVQDLTGWQEFIDYFIAPTVSQNLHSQETL